MPLHLRSPATAALAIAAALATPACSDILGLGQYTNLCGAEIDAPDVCLGGGGHTSSSNSGGAGGAAGGATGCTPDTVKTCYDGPNGTKDVGLCKHGQAICKADGDGYGTCKREVLPAVESCKSTEDENCDGFDCIVFSEVLSNAGNGLVDLQYSAFDDSYVLLAGVGQALKFPNKTFIPSQDGIAVAKLKADGTEVWIRLVSGPVAFTARNVAVDGKGRILLGGTSTSAFTVDGKNVGVGRFVLQLSPNGKANWAKTLGGVSTPPAVATTPGNDVIVSGGFTGGLTFDNGTIANAGIFLALMSGDDGSNSKAPTGAQWCLYANMQFPGELYSKADPMGNIYFAGYSTTTITFGGKALTNAGGSDWILGKVSGGGTVIWAEDVGGSNNDVLNALAVDAEGDLLTVGTFDFAFSHSPNFHFDPANGDALLVKWGTDDSMIWGQQYSATGGTLGLMTDSNSDVSLFAGFQNNIDLGNGAHAAGGSNNIGLVLAKLTPDGLPTWVRTYTVDAFLPPSVASTLMPTGEAMAVANLSAPVNFGMGSMGSASGAQFLLRFGK